MTKTDIPPGGEGEIEVSFDTGHKTGKQTKTITVTSNDPLKPTTKLKVTVFVEVEFGFSPTSVGFGKINHGQTVTKTVKILVKDPDRTQVANLKASSELVLASVIEENNSDASSGSITIKITLAAGFPPGRINEFVTATPTDTSLLETKLRIRGTVVGDVEVTPAVISFKIQSGDSNKVTPERRKLTIINRSEDRPLKIIDAVDSHDRLILEIKTLQEGQKFELLVVPKNIESTGRNLNGTIVISTNNPSQKTVSVRYSIYRKK